MAETGLTRVICCRGAVELLDELASGSRAVDELRRAFSRRVLEPALRLLAAEGALRRSPTGTWDGWPEGDVKVSLTAAGYRINAYLSDLDVWVAVYDDYLNG